MVERQTKPIAPVTPLEHTLRTMGARPPSGDEVIAIRAMLRGHAEPGQQRRAMTYMLVELCGVGRVPFAGEATEGTAFRCGSMAVGIAMSQIADAVLLRFPDEHSEQVQESEGISAS